MCIELGYPEPASERALLEGQDRRRMLEKLRPAMTPAELLAAQRAVHEVRCAPALLDCLQALLAFSRRALTFAEGLSPHAGRLAPLSAARAWALLNGRNHALPDDLQAGLLPLASHRLRPAKGSATTHRARRAGDRAAEVGAGAVMGAGSLPLRGQAMMVWPGKMDLSAAGPPVASGKPSRPAPGRSWECRTR